jgi:NADH dehydrogenase
MKVLVTGGTGVVGKSAVDHLLRRGHTVRLLSRHADEDARQWAEGVEPRAGDVGDPAALRGAADGCDAVLHVAGIVAESPPEVTFDKVNVQGTRNLVEEAARAGVRRFVYVSSLGAERGASDYHRSKKAAEDEVAAGFPREWLVVRPGNVYGPGDEVISLLLKMVRTLPAVPLVGAGDQPFQPVWVEDLGEALALAVEGEGGSGAMLDMGGPELTTMGELFDLLSELTGKSPVRIPIPEWLARSGAGAADALGLDLPVNAGQVTMLLEGNVVPEGQPNALTDVFGVRPTPLREGLRRLADALPERLPSDGTGELHRQSYWADIRGSRMEPRAILELVRSDFDGLTPDGLVKAGAEPGTQKRMEVGETLTLAIPLRGNIQVRVQEVTDEAVTCVTLEGHPLSGMIRFSAREQDGATRFEVRSYTRASDLVDRVGMMMGGHAAQAATWTGMVEEVVRRSGGEAVDGVHSEMDAVPEEEAERIERWVEELVMRRRRDESPTPGEGTSTAG